MSGIKACGLFLAAFNVIYSFAYVGSSGQDALAADINDYMPFVWVVAYFCNATLNAFLFMWISKKDLRPMVLWFSFTALLLLYRIFGIDYGKRSSNYLFVAVTMNVYIFISFFIMGMVVATIRTKNPSIQVEVVSSRPTNSRGLVNRSRRSGPSSRSIGWNTNTSRHYTTRPHFYEVRNERDNVPELREEAFGCIASSVLSNHDDFDLNSRDNDRDENNCDLNCCDNDRDGNNCELNCCDNDRDGDNQSGGGGYDYGGGCDSGGGYDDGGGYDCGGGDDGGYDCGGDNDD